MLWDSTSHDITILHFPYSYVFEILQSKKPWACVWFMPRALLSFYFYFLLDHELANVG